ncbi:helicase [Quaeritorhiza haematococci]|nr:helicase [Quaeritorhiza haematococci]
MLLVECFVGQTSVPTPTSYTSGLASAGSSTKKLSGFKPPLASGTLKRKAGDLQRRTPIPRHNPLAEGALVMPRPKKQHPRPSSTSPARRCPVPVRMRSGHERYGWFAFLNLIEIRVGNTLRDFLLILCPATLVKNWQKEFKKWLGDERVRVFAMDQNADPKDFVVGRIYSVMVCGYEKMRTCLKTIQDAGFDLVICDEDQTCVGGQESADEEEGNFDWDANSGVFLTCAGGVLQYFLKKDLSFVAIEAN